LSRYGAGIARYERDTTAHPAPRCDGINQMTAVDAATQKPARRERPEPSPYAITYTLPDAARISGLSPATLRRRGKEGALRLFRVGGRRLVDGASLRRLLGVEAG